MSSNPKVIVKAKGPSTLEWPVYRPGQLLRDDHLKLGVDYTRELSRLLFRSLFGCGVVCGLEVSAKQACGKIKVTVDAGVALDCDGDPVHVPEKKALAIDTGCDLSTLPASLWVALRGAAKCCAAQPDPCSCEDAEPSDCTRERDGFEIAIFDARPGCSCGCNYSEADRKRPASGCHCADPALECHEAHYQGLCGCNCAGCSDCDCEWILLARLDNPNSDKDEDDWPVDHLVRRFVRPVLMRDPMLDKLVMKDAAATVLNAPPEMDKGKVKVVMKGSAKAKAGKG